MQVLKGRKVDFEEVDISDPTLEDERQFMREHSTPKGGNKYGLPPQIFNDQEYCGVGCKLQLSSGVGVSFVAQGLTLTSVL